MRKYFLIALASLSLVSCEEELSTNTPAFEAQNGYTYWRATDMKAEVENGNLVVVGITDSENFTIYIDNYEFGKEYVLGEDTNCTVIYTKVIDEVTYKYKANSTIGSGFVKLDVAEKQLAGTISGTFLVDLKPDGSAIPGVSNMYFHKGIFYQIPLTTIAPQPEEPEVPETPEEPAP